MQQQFYSLLILHQNFRPENSKESFSVKINSNAFFTCSSHKVIEILVFSSINVISRRFESLFDVRLVNEITSEHESIIPITSLLDKKNKIQNSKGNNFTNK